MAGLRFRQLEYNLLFRWFVGLNMNEAVWVPTVFTKNRYRLLEGDVAEKFFQLVLSQARAADLLSDEHCKCGRHAHRSMGKPEEFPTQGNSQMGFYVHGDRLQLGADTESDDPSTLAYALPSCSSRNGCAVSAPLPQVP